MGEYDEDLIRTALERELERDGQAFYLHNRVETIEEAAEKLQQLCPKLRFIVAHGQMRERDLEEKMHAFLRGDADVLVSTTIIESGLDIPNANTIIINRADNYGLSQLYQLRGRVGRSNRRAYAYLLIPSELELTPIARRRLSAIREFSDLGAGFRIAALDLELRGDAVRATNATTGEPLPRIAPVRAGATLAWSQGPWGARVGFDQVFRLVGEVAIAIIGPDGREGMVKHESEYDISDARDFSPDLRGNLADRAFLRAEHGHAPQRKDRQRHVVIEIGDDRGPRHGGRTGEPARAEQPLLFRGDGDKEDRSLRPGQRRTGRGQHAVDADADRLDQQALRLPGRAAAGRGRPARPGRAGQPLRA